MRTFAIYYEEIKVSLNTGPDIANITSLINKLTTLSGILNGSLSATIIGSTGSLTTIEFEAGVVEDLKKAINKLAPSDARYQHEEAWHDGNGHSHVQAALIGPSIVVPVRNGKIHLGTWQQIVAVNHDNRPRTRNIDVTIMGQSK